MAPTSDFFFKNWNAFTCFEDLGWPNWPSVEILWVSVSISMLRQLVSTTNQPTLPEYCVFIRVLWCQKFWAPVQSTCWQWRMVGSRSGVFRWSCHVAGTLYNHTFSLRFYHFLLKTRKNLIRSWLFMISEFILNLLWNFFVSASWSKFGCWCKRVKVWASLSTL